MADAVPVYDWPTVLNNGAFGRALQIVNASDVAIDITGWKFRMMLRRDAGSPEVALELTSDNLGVAIVTAAQGKLQVYVAPESAAKLYPGDYAYDLVRTVPAPVQPLLRGTIPVRQGVTR